MGEVVDLRTKQVVEPEPVIATAGDIPVCEHGIQTHLRCRLCAASEPFNALEDEPWVGTLQTLVDGLVEAESSEEFDRLLLRIRMMLDDDTPAPST